MSKTKGQEKYGSKETEWRTHGKCDVGGLKMYD